MNKIVSTIAVLAFFGALTWAAQPTRDRDASNDAIAIQRLNKRVAALETKLAEVQRELKTLSERPPLITVPAPGSGPVPTRPGTRTLPPHGSPDGEGEIWREGHINGWKFYVIPLSAEEARSK